MTQSELNYNIQSFDIEAVRKRLSPIVKLRKEFQKDFSFKTLEQMRIDEYVEGKPLPDGTTNKTTFCYRVECELAELGDFHGSAATKFGVYYSKKLGRYKSVKRFGDSHKQAYKNIRKEIVELIEAAKKGDYQALVNNQISPMFKGKILSIYFPEEHLPVLSPEHVDYFMTLFNLDTIENISFDPIYKRQILVGFKNNHEVMKSWSLDEFMLFLYDKYSPNRKGTETPIETPIQIDEIKGEYGYKMDTESNIGRSANPDYEAKARANKKLGDRGEYIVLNHEKDKLNKLGLIKLSKKVHKCEVDSEGYDILSYDKNGKELYIEVKASNQSPSDFEFYYTENERLTALRLKEQYEIHFVFKVYSKNPKIFNMGNPFYPKEQIKLKPIQYKANVAYIKK